MQIENRSGFFPRHYRIQPVRYQRVYNAWGAVFEAPNGDEYMIALHVRKESVNRAMIRNMQKGRPVTDMRREEIVDGFQLFRVHHNRPLEAKTQIIHNLNYVVETLEALLQKSV